MSISQAKPTNQKVPKIQRQNEMEHLDFEQVTINPAVVQIRLTKIKTTGHPAQYTIIYSQNLQPST